MDANSAENDRYRFEVIPYATRIKDGCEYSTLDTVIRRYDKASTKTDEFIDVKVVGRLEKEIETLRNERDKAERLAAEWEHRAELRANMRDEVQAENDLLKAQIRLAEIRAINKPTTSS